MFTGQIAFLPDCHTDYLPHRTTAEMGWHYLAQNDTASVLPTQCLHCSALLYSQNLSTRYFYTLTTVYFVFGQTSQRTFLSF